MDRKARFWQWWKEAVPTLAAVLVLWLGWGAIRYNLRDGFVVMTLLAAVGAFAIARFILKD